MQYSGRSYTLYHITYPALLETNFEKISMIFTEDFNFNLHREPSLLLITFLREKFKSKISNNLKK